MMEPKIAVLLAAYNGEPWLREQIDSILAQKGVNPCIFISLDKSSDNSFEIISKYQNRYPERVFILPYGKRYGSAGQNFFRLILNVDFSDFGYVSFADQDDLWLASKLIRGVDKINELKIDAYSSDVLAFWESGAEKVIKKSYPQTDFDFLFESSGPGCTFILKNNFAISLKEELKKIGSDRTKIWAHDWFTYSYARSSGFKWYIDEKPSMLYRQHDANQVGSNSGIKAFLLRAKVIASGEGFTRVLNQATALHQEQLKPVQFLKQNSRLSYLRLSMLFRQCRRKFSEQILFFLSCCVMAVKGPSNYD